MDKMFNIAILLLFIVFPICNGVAGAPQHYTITGKVVNTVETPVEFIHTRFLMNDVIFVESTLTDIFGQVSIFPSMQERSNLSSMHDNETISNKRAGYPNYPYSLEASLQDNETISSVFAQYPTNVAKGQENVDAGTRLGDMTSQGYNDGAIEQGYSGQVILSSSLLGSSDLPSLQDNETISSVFAQYPNYPYSLEASLRGNEAISNKVADP